MSRKSKKIAFNSLELKGSKMEKGILLESWKKGLNFIFSQAEDVMSTLKASIRGSWAF